MTQAAAKLTPLSRPEWPAVVELLKPITWFPPMWAFACGVVSSGMPLAEQLLVIVVGIALAGPLLCGASQVVNDWFDRDVDAINEPQRPIPSGRVPGRWGLLIAVVWTLLSALVALTLGLWVFAAAIVGLVLAWAYSAPPLRLKQNGWWGNSAVAVSYEGLAWITGAAVMIGGNIPDTRILILAALYSLGAHGIMTLNDFKSIEGDLRMGVRSLPVQLGVQRAARVAGLMMAAPQMVVVMLLWHWGQATLALAVGALLLVQTALMRRLFEDPREKAPWYNSTGVTLYVLGMLLSAFAVREIIAL